MNRAAELAIKREVIVTTNTVGWNQVVRIAEQLVVAKEKAALAETDDAKIIGLQRRAQAAREFLTEFLRKIDTTRQPDTPLDESDGLILFNEVAYE